MIPSEVKSIHFVGIGGVGMSALARVLLELGYRVSGSDLKENELTQGLTQKGAKLYYQHRPANVEGADLVVFSSIIPPSNPEIKASLRGGIPLVSRGKLLSWLVNPKKGVIIAGTHGKTTTTSLISSLLLKGGFDPTLFIGGEIEEVGGNARLGEGEWVVAESDESDGSFLWLSPLLGVITNVEDDHLEYWGSKKRLREAFLEFALNLKPGGTLLFNEDDEGAREVGERMKTSSLSWGIKRGKIRAEKITLRPLFSEFELRRWGRLWGRVKLSLPGLYNIYNALGALAVGEALKIEKETILEVLSTFRGVKRRFEKLGERKGVLVVDDYAHHPTEIESLLQVAKSTGRRVVAVFQPHRYTRTRNLLDRFADSFKDAEIVVLTEIYPAGEKPLPGIEGRLLFERLKKVGKEVYFFPSLEEVSTFVEDILRENDLLLTIGAGDVWKVGRKFLTHEEPH